MSGLLFPRIISLLGVTENYGSDLHLLGPGFLCASEFDDSNFQDQGVGLEVKEDSPKSLVSLLLRWMLRLIARN